jgi:glyoxylase-like metal-dependent hydrolase (beta-lactamase superfamily II)
VTLVGSGALTRRGPVQLCGDLYQVAGGDLTHPYDASAYLLMGSRPVLFDCGSVEGHSALVANLRRLGVEPGDLAAVYATHGHYDHVSGLAPLRELADVPLHLHAAEHDAVRSGDPLLTSARPLYDRAFPSLEVEHALEESAGVIHTPGHSPGSVCFLLETGGHRVLVAGDTLWGGFHPALGSDIEAWRDSLDRLLLEDFDVMSFGHVVSHLVVDAHAKVAAARERLGVLYDPWFVPPFAA